jgi:hypothetical protein
MASNTVEGSSSDRGLGSSQDVSQNLEQLEQVEELNDKIEHMK